MRDRRCWHSGFFRVSCTGGISAVLLLCCLAGADAGDPLTLEQSIHEAMAKSRRLRAQEERVDQARSVKNQARADFLPKVGTTYGYTRDSETRLLRSTLMTTGRPVAISSQDNYQWTGFVKQPIFTGFALLSTYRLAELGIDLSETQLELEKLDLTLRVKESYFNVLIADKSVEVAEREVESLRSNVKVASNFYDVGIIPVNDLLKAEVELANAEQNLVKALKAAEASRAAFNTVLFRPTQQPVELVDILTHKREVGKYETYVQSAMDGRPELKVVDINLLRTDEQIRLSRSKLYPEVSLNYQYTKQGDSPEVSGSEFHDAGYWQAVTTLTWTFWEWGKTHYAEKEKRSVKRELMETKAELEANIKLEVKQAVLDLDVAEQNIPTTQKAVRQAEENLRVNEERYKAQVTTITEVLDAQALLTRARVNFYRALYDHNLAKARLERAVGKY
ncbi:MAG: TolC family protein [Thermodesulfobacteriota bacterium]